MTSPVYLRVREEHTECIEKKYFRYYMRLNERP